MVTRPLPAAPFSASLSGDINQVLAQIADAINSKASATIASAYHSIALIDDTGQTWRIKVHPDGTLHTDLVTPP
jgi:archaellum component FlaG (FlaF/FlaG flagellin family)